MKKFWLMILVGVLALGLLCGCGDSAGSSGGSDKVKVLSEAEIEQMYSDAEAFKGAQVTLTGQVFTAPEKDGEKTYLQIFCDTENSEKGVVVYYESTDPAVKAQDFVEVTGIVKGTLKGENAFGAKLVYPLIEASEVKVVDAQEVVSPTLASFDIGASATQAECDVTVEKVEFAEEVTRVYVKVQNNSSATVSLNTYSEVAVQNGKQFNSTFNDNFYVEYPELPYEVRAGVLAEGVVLFPAMEQQNFEFVMTGYDDVNYNELEFVIPVEIATGE